MVRSMLAPAETRFQVLDKSPLGIADILIVTLKTINRRQIVWPSDAIEPVIHCETEFTPANRAGLQAPHRQEKCRNPEKNRHAVRETQRAAQSSRRHLPRDLLPPAPFRR